MSLETPMKIRMLQKKLYQKAKEEPGYRFYLLYDKIYREDVLSHAYALAKSNQGAPGVDGQTFSGVESQGLEEWLNGIREDLRAKTYQPQAVRRVVIPKSGGGERPLGIPTVRDRVVQTAAKLLLEPIFEADFDPNAYGYRPKRSAQEAIQKVHKLLCEGYEDVVDADLSKYFRYHSTLRTNAMRGSEDCRSGHAASDQDVVEGSGRGAGQKRETAGQRWEGKHLWNPTGRRYQSLARQPVHEPFSEVLADHREE
jgi:retron-type reverse transcriptase